MHLIRLACEPLSYALKHKIKNKKNHYLTIGKKEEEKEIKRIYNPCNQISIQQESGYTSLIAIHVLGGKNYLFLNVTLTSTI